MLAKEKVIKKNMITNIPTFLFFITSCTALKFIILTPLKFFLFVSINSECKVSLKTKIQSIIAIKEKTEANIIGKPYPNLKEKNPPIAGPNTKPRPNAAPIYPIPLERFSLVVISETTDWAAERFAEKIPANALDRRSNVKDGYTPVKTRAIKKYEITFPAKLIIRIGFLPYISEREPQTGVNINCINEKIPTVKPITDSFSIRTFFRKSGRRGIIIPNPNKSIKIVKNITRNV